MSLWFALHKDTELVSKNLWAEGQDEETELEEGEDVCRSHAGSPAGCEGKRVSGLQGKPKDSEERGGKGKSAGCRLAC